MKVFTTWLRAPLKVAPNFSYSKLLADFDFDLNVYMDDILFFSYMPYDRTMQLIDLLLSCFKLFAITVHPTKSVLLPSSAVEYLGHVVGT